MREYEFLVTDGSGRTRRVPFPGPHFIIGSAPDCAVRFAASMVRERHAEIIHDDSGVWWVKDLTGANLLWVSGKVAPHGQLTDGLFIRIGRVELEVRSKGEPEAHEGPSGTMRVPTPLGREPVHDIPEIKRSSRATKAEPAHPAGDGDTTGVVPGAIIDRRYRVLARIAAGGMGEVYKVEHIELGKVFALKVMLPGLSHDEEFVGRFKREAIASSRVGQQNIVDISDFGRTDDDRFYFVMEYLDGITLTSLLRREGAQPIERVINISNQAAHALAAAHDLGIIHRDLKPENIMLLQRRGQPDFVKVLDFGVAKVTGGHGQGGHTAVGMVVGTPRYMSPEQAKALPVDARSDIYSLGLIIYELICGKPTFTGETPSILIVKQVTAPPPPLEPTNGEVPAELEQLVYKMLAKDPSERPQKMAEVVEALEALIPQVRTGKFVGTTPSGKFAKPAEATGPQPAAAVATPTGSTPAAATATGSLPTPSVVLQAPPRSPVPFILVGMLAVGALGGVGWVATRPTPEKVVVVAPPPPPKTDTPPVAAPPAGAKITLTITSVPERAEVYEGDVLLGNTPLKLSRDSGAVAQLKVVLRDHVTEEKKLGFVSDGEVVVQLQREKKGGATPPPKKGGSKPAAKPGDGLKDPYAPDDFKPLPD